MFGSKWIVNIYYIEILPRITIYQDMLGNHANPV